ncbi:MAG: hypothetical protein ACRCU1_08475, partial [Alsobacter sp.]
MSQVHFQKKGLQEIALFLRKMGEFEVHVGIVGARANELEEGSTKTLAELGAIHEYGSDVEPGDVGYVPERSFIRSTLANRRADIAKLMASECRAVLAGKRTPAAALEVVGAAVASWIKLAVTSGEGIGPPLAESTIERKGSSRPLVDHGQLIAHGVSHLVTKR